MGFLRFVLTACRYRIGSHCCPVVDLHSTRRVNDIRCMLSLKAPSYQNLEWAVVVPAYADHVVTPAALVAQSFMTIPAADARPLARPRLWQQNKGPLTTHSLKHFVWLQCCPAFQTWPRTYMEIAYCMCVSGPSLKPCSLSSRPSQTSPVQPTRNPKLVCHLP